MTASEVLFEISFIKKDISLGRKSLRVLNNWNLDCILKFKWIKMLNFSKVF